MEQVKYYKSGANNNVLVSICPYRYKMQDCTGLISPIFIGSDTCHSCHYFASIDKAKQVVNCTNRDGDEYDRDKTDL